eukprot:Tbor_TRINITY_DN5681_c1_g1::TRINITY_DN5681_c1_g1_i2::g.8625::m.8625
MKGLSQKTIEKLSTLKEILSTATLTIRQVATILGVCRYAAAIVNNRLFDFYTLFSWARRLGALVQTKPSAWDEYVFLPFRNQMKALIEVLLIVQPIPIYIPEPKHRPLTLITDASKSGYGGVLISSSGIINYTAGSFLSEFPSSVRAEPEWMVKAALALLQKTKRTFLF